MTTTIKQHKTKTHHISLYAEGNLLIVEACPLYDDHTCGYPVNKMTYHHSEQKKAVATFKRYIKKYE
jgi:hypothetical protein